MVLHTVLTWGLNVQVLQERKLHVREVVVCLYGYYDASKQENVEERRIKKI